MAKQKLKTKKTATKPGTALTEKKKGTGVKKNVRVGKCGILREAGEGGREGRGGWVMKKTTDLHIFGT